MNALIIKSILEKLLISLQPYIDKKNLSQATSHIYIRIEKSNLTMRATDYEMGMQLTTSTINIKKEGDATANGKKLLNIIKNLDEEEIELYTENNFLNIRQKNAHFKIPMFNTEDFPTFPKVNDLKEININSIIFSKSLKYATPCIDTNNPKYELNGLLVDFNNNQYNVVSTDTKRLSIISNNENCDMKRKIILHRKSILEIQKIIHESSQIYLDETNLVIKNNNIYFFSKLINGNYPDYERIITENIKHTLVLKTQPILDALKNIQSLSSTVNIVFNKNRIKFSTFESSQDQAQIEIKENLDIEDFNLNISIQYITNFLTIIEEEVFTIKLNEEKLPFILESNNFKTIVMPLTV